MISKPIRIALVGTILYSTAWVWRNFSNVRPKPPSVPTLGIENEKDNNKNVTTNISAVQEIREQWLNLPDNNHQDRTSIRHKDQRLELVHIPKTAGSALEIAAAKAGVPWSVCHFRERFRNRFLPYPLPENVYCPNDSSFSSEISKKQQHEYYWRQMGGVTPWHVPPSFFRNTTDKQLSNNNNNTTIQFSFPGSFYDQSALFAVVRHPYDRMVSEFNYVHRQDLRGGGKLANASESHLRMALNGWLQQRLTPY